MTDEEIATLKADVDRMWRVLKRIDEIYELALIDWSRGFVRLKDATDAKPQRKIVVRRR